MAWNLLVTKIVPWQNEIFLLSFFCIADCNDECVLKNVQQQAEMGNLSFCRFLTVLFLVLTLNKFYIYVIGCVL